jgi:NAD-dependent dihydropyrimidine dehydrogenase PreA subunit
VAACEPDALRLPEQEEEGPPAPAKLARVRIDPETCLPYSGPECGACAHACPVPGALEWEGGLRPVIDEERCTGCALCREACIMEPKAVEVSALIPEEETAGVP